MLECGCLILHILLFGILKLTRDRENHTDLSWVQVAASLALQSLKGALSASG